MKSLDGCMRWLPKGIFIMNYDEQAYLEFIDGQNDAIELLSPQSNSYYYLQGWHDTKRRLASGELCWVFQEHKTEYSQWEEF